MNMRPHRQTTASNECASSLSDSASDSTRSTFVQVRRVDSLARYREHPGRHVDGDDSSRRADGAGGGQRRLAAAGRDIEHAIAGAQSCELDQPVVHRLRGALEGRPPSLPALGAVVPRGLLLALYFQIVGVLIAHGNYLRSTVTPRSRATTLG